MVRGELPTLKGITAIRQSIAEVCQLFTLFDARSAPYHPSSESLTILLTRSILIPSIFDSNVSVLVDEEESRLVILCDITMSLAPDPEQKKIKTSAAIVIKKALGVEAEKMSEEEAILDRTALARRLTELGMVSPAQDAE